MLKASPCVLKIEYYELYNEKKVPKDHKSMIIKWLSNFLYLKVNLEHNIYRL